MSKRMYFGGVEGGATHSNLVICDESGGVVGRARGPGTNHWILGIDGCADRIIAMVRAAKEDAGLPVDEPLDSLGLTLSGCEQDSSNADLAARVRDKDSTSAREIYVGSDTAGSLFTGAPDGGMVVIAALIVWDLRGPIVQALSWRGAQYPRVQTSTLGEAHWSAEAALGTGSNALLRTPDGQQYGCGGWGYLLGDEGGAYWIAHRAVKTVFDDDDGLQPSPHPTARVWRALQEHFKSTTKADLLPHAYKHFDKTHFAGITVKLSQLALEGDALAQHLFGLAGAALASHIAALAERGMRGQNGSCTLDKGIRVVCVGSVWKSWSVMKHSALQHLAARRVKIDLELVRLRVSSAMGAAWLAAKHVGFDLPRDDSAFCEVFYKYSPDINGKTRNINGKSVDNGTKENGLVDICCGCEDWSHWK